MKKMNRCLFLIFIKSCLFLWSDRRAVEAQSAEGSNTFKYSTLLPNTESTTPTKVAVNTVHISTERNHLLSASTGVPSGIPNAGPQFHAGSFIGGMIMAFIVLLVVTVGYRFFFSQREIRYRVMGGAKRKGSKERKPGCTNKN